MDMKISSAIVFLIFLAAAPSDARGPCEPVQCGKGGGPAISFPFYSSGQPRDCGVPGFELSCRSNTTLIKLPSCHELVVKSISRRDKRLNLLDPGNCVHRVFLDLNLSGTPFQYYYTLKSYTYINCSVPVNPLRYSSPEIPCLSGPGYVYTVESSLYSTVAASWGRSFSCRAVKTVEIPFPYSPYLSDDSFGLGLTWKTMTDSCKGCEQRRNKALSIALLVVVAVMAGAVWTKIHNSKEQDLDAEKLLHN